MVERVALLIDGDNIAASHAGQILGHARARGRLDVARVYAAANRPSDWLTTPGLRVMHAGTGKNAADLLLAIDAMELALTAPPERFVIASSDGDFTHLALRLRERGHCVDGLGASHAPQTFRAACSEFLDLAVPSTAPPGLPAPKVKGSELDRKLRNLIASHSKNGDGILFAVLGPKMHTAFGTRSSALPEGNWRSYIANRPDLYTLDDDGPLARVRFRPEGFAKLR